MGRDRERLVPGAAHRKALWPVIGFPGGVLVDGEVVGTWRTKSQGRCVAFTIDPFTRVPKAAKTAIEREASLVAQLRGAEDALVTYAG
jgi:hypothetical protein